MLGSRTIVEVLRRSNQGMTRPFLCRANDGVLYYVKGAYAGRESLCNEWVAGNLGRRFGVPIPPFVIADVPSDLVNQSARPDIHDLGSGLVFASQALEDCREITWKEAAACDQQLKARVLLFDWWVHNEDRTLAEEGGNPNLLITADRDPPQVWAFDFNLAFDRRFCEEDFWTYHVFSVTLPDWPLEFRDRIMPEMESCAGGLDAVLESLPREWLYIDGDDTMGPRMDVPLVRTTLLRAFEHPREFWSRP